VIGVEEPECEEDKGSVKPINEWNLLRLDIYFGKPPTNVTSN
jgi:hypothetical protein